MDPLPQSFYDRPSLDVARALLGCVLVRDEVQLRIVETEAYLANDSACHAARGRTPRNAPMWGPAGRTYVYLCYGIHHLLNLVTEAEGTPGCVLIRGCTVLAGVEQVRTRRRGRLDLDGPGKVGQALGLDTSWTDRPLDGALRVIAGPPPVRIEATPRIGIAYAQPADQQALYRFVAAG